MAARKGGGGTLFASTLAGNLAPTLFAGLATLPGTSSLAASSTLLLQALAALPGASSFSANTFDPMVRRTPIIQPTVLPGWSYYPQDAATRGVQFVAGGISYDGTAVLAGSSSLSATSSLVLPSFAALPGSSVLSVLATIPWIASATLPGASSLAADSKYYASALATLPGSGSLAADSKYYALALATLPGASSISASTAQFAAVLATLPGASSLAASTRWYAAAYATLPGSSSLVADSKYYALAQATLPGSSSLSATSKAFVTAQAVLPGSGIVSAATIQRMMVAATLPGTSSVIASGSSGQTVTWQGSAQLAGTSLLQGGPVSNVASLVLNASTAGLEGYTVRNLMPNPSVGGSALVRVTFTCQNSSAGNTKVDHASIGVSSGTNANTTATPVELLFGGASGFTLTPGTSIVSDWTPFTFSVSDSLVVVTDFNAAGGSGFCSYDDQIGFYTAYLHASAASYNSSTTPAGSSSAPSLLYVVSSIDISPVMPTLLAAGLATLPGSSSLSASATQLLKALATLPGASALVADTKFYVAAYATLPGASSLRASTANVLSLAVTLPGTSGLSANSSPANQISATFAGSSTLTAGAPGRIRISTAFAGASTLASSWIIPATEIIRAPVLQSQYFGNWTYPVVGFVQGQPAAVIPNPPFVAFNGTGSLSATTKLLLSATATLAGSSSLSANATKFQQVWQGSAVFAGQGALSASAQSVQFSTVQRTPVVSRGSVWPGYWHGEWTNKGFVPNPGTLWSASAVLAGSGTLLEQFGSLSAFRSTLLTETPAWWKWFSDESYVLQGMMPSLNAWQSSATLPGSSGLSALMWQRWADQATFAGVGGLSTSAARTLPTLATLPGLSSLSAIVTAQHPALAALPGSSGLSATAVQVLPALATLGGVGAISAFGFLTPGGIEWPDSAVLTSLSTLSGSALQAMSATAAMPGAGSLSGVATIPWMATAALSGLGTVSASTSINVSSQALLSGSSVLRVPAGAVTVALSGRASFDDISQLFASSQIVTTADAVLGGQSSFAADTFVPFTITDSAVFAGDSSLSISAFVKHRSVAMAVVADRAKYKNTHSNRLVIRATVKDI